MSTVCGDDLWLDVNVDAVSVSLVCCVGGRQDAETGLPPLKTFQHHSLFKRNIEPQSPQYTYIWLPSPSDLWYSIHFDGLFDDLFIYLLIHLTTPPPSSPNTTTPPIQF